jgi:alkyl sulfatase BDS1-like metallo-beta-lactamase superfamily hydrolase
VDAAGLVDANVVKLGPTGSGTAQTARDVGGNVDVVVSTRATPAQVNAEVVDCLNVDTYAEPGQEAPAATNTLVKKIGYLFKFLRNRISTIATTIKVYADDGTTVDQKSTISDDATTFERGEFGTGP